MSNDVCGHGLREGLAMSLPRLRTDETGLLVVDVQERFAPVIHEMERVVHGCVIAIRAARELELPIYVTEQYPAGLGKTVPEIVDVLGDAYRPTEKFSFSACGADGLSEAIETSRRKSLLVVGIEAHVCVMQTVLDLLDDGYDVFPVADAISSRSPEDRSLALDRMRVSGATLVSTEMLLFELLRTAKDPRFRALQKLIK